MIAKAINRIFEAGYKRVIVPGFGAFIKRNSGEIVFTDMLSEDDGVLIASLIGSGLNAADARQAVDKFIVSLRSGLALNGRASVEGIGVVTKTANGSYALEETETENETTAGQVKETVIPDPTHNIIETAEIIVETILEELVVTEPEAVIESEERVEDFIHHSFTKKARLRNAMYGDYEDEPATIKEESVSTPDTTAVPDEPTSQPETVQSDVKETNATTHTDNIKPESRKDTTNKAAEIHTVKSDFTAATENDESEPFKPQINIRRPAKSKKRIDGVMVIAVIALIITLGIIVYGYFAERDINMLKGEESIMIEMEQQAE